MHNAANDPLRPRFTAFVRERQQDFYKLAYSYVHNQDAAMDMVQNAIVQALGSLHRLRQPQYMETWFYRILVNACLSYLRTAGRVVLVDQLPPQSAPHSDLDRAMDIDRAMDQLPPKLKTVIVLRYFEDRPLQQIAMMTGVGLSCAKGRLYRALQALQRILGEELEELQQLEAKNPAATDTYRDREEPLR